MYWPFCVRDKEALKEHLDVVDHPEAVQVLPLTVHLNQLLKHLGRLLQLPWQFQHIACNAHTTAVIQLASVVSILLIVSDSHLSILFVVSVYCDYCDQLTCFLLVSNFNLLTFLVPSKFHLCILRTVFQLCILFVVSIFNLYAFLVTAKLYLHTFACFIECSPLYFFHQI